MKRILLATLVLLMFLAGCQKEEANGEEPASPIPGYYSLTQRIDGGVEVDGVTLSQVDAGLHGGETLISIAFQSTGGTALNDTPKYSVRGIDGPSRLCVTMPSSMYALKEPFPQAAGLYESMYAQPPTELGGEYRLYFQFTGNIAFQVREERGALVICVLPSDPSNVERYYAVLAMREGMGPIAAQFGLEPVLCDDDEQRVYISPPWATIEEADDLAAQLNARLDAIASNDRAWVIAQKGHHAPDINALLTREDLTRLGALRSSDGSVSTAVPWAVDARFLCWLPDGVSALCAQPVSVMENGEAVTYEQVWQFQADGSRTRYLDSDLAYIHRAVFSQDGRYLALVERVEGNQQLYLYDNEMKELEFLSAEGMGDFTVGLSWAEDGCLYAMSGDEDMHLLVFDPKQQSGSQSRVRMVEEEKGSLGSVFTAGGQVYSNDAGEGVIYRVDPLTGEREEFATGAGFSISPNGARMMLLSEIPAEDEEGEAQSVLRVKDMQSLEETTIYTGVAYRDSCWSLDGETLHFLVRNPDDEEYPGLLYTASANTGEARLRGALASDSIYTGAQSDEIILVSYYQQDESVWNPITYRLRLAD